MLTRFGLRTDQANSGRIALEMLERANYNDDDPKKRDALLSQLRRLLEDNDSEAFEVIEALGEIPAPGSHASILKRLSVAIGGYYFDKAIEEVDTLESIKDNR
jgi:hypothetical protein